MERMFYNASSFRSYLSSWNTSSVTDMSYMFGQASSFNQTLCWDTSKVINNADMFTGSQGSFTSTPYPNCRTAPPTTRPSTKPTFKPTFKPSLLPSLVPTSPPSYKPTVKPSVIPTYNPSVKPSLLSTHVPTSRPSYKPTSRPSIRPSSSPSVQPTIWLGWITHTSPLYGNTTSNLSNNLNVSHGSCLKGYKVVSIQAWTSNWIYQLSATCDDHTSSTLGPWGVSQNVLDVNSMSCPIGFNGWNITHGNFIGRMVLSCANSLYSAGNGLSEGSGSTNSMSLLSNQSIVGFQVFSDSLGIHAIRIGYAEFPPKSKCYDYNYEPTGNCPITADYLAIVWGVLSVVGPAAIIVAIVAYIRKRRHRQEFQNHDLILPLR